MENTRSIMNEDNGRYSVSDLEISSGTLNMGACGTFSTEDTLWSGAVPPAPYIAPSSDVAQTENLASSDNSDDRETTSNGFLSDESKTASLACKRHSASPSQRARFDLPLVDEKDKTTEKTRKARPCYAAGSDLSRRDSGHGSADGSSTAGSSKSSKASTRVDIGGSLVSQKMMDKLVLFDTSRDGSMNLEEEMKSIPITALGEKRWAVPKKKKKKKMVQRNLAHPWWSHKRYSTRFLMFFIAGVCAVLALLVGLGVGLWERAVANRPQETSTWKPSPGMSWQIQLSTIVTDPTYLYSTFDVDLFDTPTSTIKELHNLGRRVICYFSAGTLENWRPDYNDFPQTAVGNDLADWVGERYLDYSDTKVRSLMVKRIEKAKEKGCDGVDPDNVDIFEANTTTLGFSLTQADAVDYLNYLSDHAHKMKVAIGLKNSPTIAEKVVGKMDWAIVESCALYDECGYFQPYIEAGRPVMHIEYPDNSVKPINATYGLQQFLFDSCQASGTHLYSTLIKKTSLDEWALSCPYGLPAYGLY